MLRATNHAGQFQKPVTLHTDTVGGLLKNRVFVASIGYTHCRWCFGVKDT